MRTPRSKLKKINKETSPRKPITKEEEAKINDLSDQFNSLTTGIIGKSPQKEAFHSAPRIQQKATPSTQHWYGEFGSLASFEQPATSSEIESKAQHDTEMKHLSTGTIFGADNSNTTSEDAKVESTTQQIDANSSEFPTSNEELFDAIKKSDNFFVQEEASPNILSFESFKQVLIENSGFDSANSEAQPKTEMFDKEENLDEVPSTSSAFIEDSKEPGEMQKGRITRKKFREFVEKHMDKLQEIGERTFMKLESLKSVNSSRKETIDSVDFVFKLVELRDGGILVKAHAILPSFGDPLKIEMNYSSCVFIEKTDIQHGKMAMQDAIRLLPKFIDGDLIDPVSDYSTEYFNKRFVFKNDKLLKRFENFSLFCRLCELHVKSPNFVLDHVRNVDHCLLKRRFADRYHLCLHWHKVLNAKQLKVSDVCSNHINRLHDEVKAKMNDFYKHCSRAHVINELKELENSVKGYKIKFHLFGSYQSSLVSYDSPIIDCFVLIRRIAFPDQELSYAEKLEVFKKLPFNNPERFETAFHGYLVEWETKHFKEKFFFTMDPKASNAILSSHLMALYVFLAPPLLDLAILFRMWAKCLKVLRSSGEFRVSGAIFDYMVVYFMQKYYGLPVIDESITNCSLEEFLKMDIKEEVALVKPCFDDYFAKAKSTIPSLPTLFMNLLLYFGCGFDSSNVVQITSPAEVKKENNAFRTVKIMDPIAPMINLFHMRPEHAFHLDNLIFFASCEFLQPPNATNFFERISVEYISSIGKDSGFPFLVSVQTNAGFGSSVKNSQMPNYFKDGLGIWYPDKIPHITCKCLFCFKQNHTERACKFLQLAPIPDENPSDQIYQIFSTLIVDYYKKERIDDKHLKFANDFITNLEQIIETKTNNKLSLLSFGSLKSGFGSKSSDFDLCIQQFDENKIDEKLGRDLLIAIGDAMLLSESDFEIRYVFGAKVPILTFNCSKDGQALKGDISFSNCLALQNTKLLASYAEFDERVAPLGLMIKRWAGCIGINNAASHSFSSYALSIMLIHFLQRIEPPVLPNLQDDDEFGTEKIIVNDCEVQFAQPSAEYRRQFSKNQMSLGELFAKFFDYFGSFNWSDEVLQIRKKDKLLKMDKEWHRSPIAIEDPFDLNHNLTACIRFPNSLYIKRCFNVIQLEMRRTDSIFLEEKFDFDSESFKDLMSNLYNNSKNAISCHKCGEMGHHKSNCTKEPIRKEPPKKYAVPMKNNMPQQQKPRPAHYNHYSQNGQYPPQNGQFYQQAPRNYQQNIPMVNPLYHQQRVAHGPPASVFFPPHQQQQNSQPLQGPTFFQQPVPNQQLYQQVPTQVLPPFQNQVVNNPYNHQQYPPTNIQAMQPPQTNNPNVPQYTFFGQRRY